jgi:hypothetical protein
LQAAGRYLIGACNTLLFYENFSFCIFAEFYTFYSGNKKGQVTLSNNVTYNSMPVSKNTPLPVRVSSKQKKNFESTERKCICLN